MGTGFCIRKSVMMARQVVPAGCRHCLQLVIPRPSEIFGGLV